MEGHALVTGLRWLSKKIYKRNLFYTADQRKKEKIIVTGSLLRPYTKLHIPWDSRNSSVPHILSCGDTGKFQFPFLIHSPVPSWV